MNLTDTDIGKLSENVVDQIFGLPGKRVVNNACVGKTASVLRRWLAPCPNVVTGRCQPIDSA